MICLLQVLQALDRYHDDRAMVFMSVLQSLVISIATWHDDVPTDGKSRTSSAEFPAIITSCRPSAEAIWSFVREYQHQRELSERLMDVDNADEKSDEMIDSEAAADDDIDDKEVKDAEMMCEDSKHEPPDHIKLVMEV